MNQILDEQLSSLLDGELSEEQYDLLLRRLDAEPDLRERFARYSLIGDVLTDSEVQVGALRIADHVRTELGSSDDGKELSVPVKSIPNAPGLFGAGIAAAAALIVALNLSPGSNESSAPQLAGVAPVAIDVPAVVRAEAEPPRANVAPERMTRYLVNHARFENAASRQFVDSHVVMPAFQRVAWQTSGIRR
ncbi:MAG: sigma-E factor negative regulatory protein [Gammaproteobacteria bacterium]|nr:sigma-E factor negative regulatory protein [Gammaproteobacteria bacterium]